MGARVLCARPRPRSGRHFHRLFVFGLISRGVDNHAHAGGFVGGYLAGMWLDPMTRERVDHLIVGVFCIVVTFGAVGASIVAGIPDTLAYFMQF